MKTKFKAWSISTGVICDKLPLLGRYWWWYGKLHEIPKHLEGCRYSLFKTRKEARLALQADKDKGYIAYPESKVIRVKITIEEVK